MCLAGSPMTAIISRAVHGAMSIQLSHWMKCRLSARNPACRVVVLCCCATCRAALDEFDLSRFSRYGEMDYADAEGHDADTSSSDNMSASGHEDSTSVPGTDMQRLRQELLLRTRRMAHRHKQLLRLQQAGLTPAAAATNAAADAAEELSPPAALHQKLDSIRAMIKANADRWGTTQQSPAEIAQQIADSNRAAGGGDGDSDGEGEGSDDDEPLALKRGEERYADASTVGAELKEMDEIFEVLAKVRHGVAGMRGCGRGGQGRGSVFYKQ